MGVASAGPSPVRNVACSRLRGLVLRAVRGLADTSSSAFILPTRVNQTSAQLRRCARGLSTPIVGADGRKAVKPVKVVSPLAVVALGEGVARWLAGGR